VSAMTHQRLRTLRHAIATAATPDARAHAAAEYVDAHQKAPRAEQFLAALGDALSGRYSAEQRERMQDAIDEVKARQA
jgi:hypothetical protein